VGSPGTCPPIIEKRPCIYNFLPPSPKYFGLPTQYFWQVYASGTYNGDSKPKGCCTHSKGQRWQRNPPNQFNENWVKTKHDRHKKTANIYNSILVNSNSLFTNASVFWNNSSCRVLDYIITNCNTRPRTGKPSPPIFEYAACKCSCICAFCVAAYYVFFAVSVA